MAKRLTRETGDAFLGGVASGFARYFDVDPVITRLAFVLLAFFNGVGLILYLICWVIMPVRASVSPSSGSPERPGSSPAPGEEKDAGEAGPAPADRFVDEVRQAGERVVGSINEKASDDDSRGQLVGGAILVGIGLIFLLPQLNLWFWPHWLDLWDLWPVILIVAGAAMLIRSRNTSG